MFSYDIKKICTMIIIDSTSNRNNEVSYKDDSVVTMIIYINIDDTSILKPPVTTLRYKTDTFEDVQ